VETLQKTRLVEMMSAKIQEPPDGVGSALLAKLLALVSFPTRCRRVDTRRP